MLSILKADLAGKQPPPELVAPGSFEMLELEAQSPKAYSNLGNLQAPMLQLSSACIDTAHHTKPCPCLTPVNRGNSLDAALGMDPAPVDPLYASPSSSVLASSRETTAALADAPLCDTGLDQLDIGHWTRVTIGNHVAAKCILLYLDNDDALLTPFDPTLFLSHLISKRTGFCSSLLVNALLWWACQAYSHDLPEAHTLISSFEYESLGLWDRERSHGHDSVPNMIAAEFLSLGFLAQGRKDQVRLYFFEVLNMGIRMGLFCIKDKNGLLGLDDCTNRAFMRAAWGVFIWIM
ncbi:hypothetical protein CDD82_2749 [Ophiocordyceps australis]|uniref:Transcription factor domain-containing protein n=1 Tax=Ophiocordyceps australis TaxID=1399860 RepID=A0A2C5XNB8_9HYPO|nr:hypothetical protein CDD82_2749 [Ophiocordyceps australis]